MTDRYIDYKNGNDSTGTGATGAPWQTLSKAIASSTAGDTVYVRGAATDPTTYYRELGKDISKQLTLRADTGHTPTIVGTHEYTSWSATAGRTNVYEAAYTPNLCSAVWNGATILTSVADVATCESTVNSRYFDNAGDKLYINIGGVPTSIEVYDQSNTWSLTVSGANCVLDGLRFRFEIQAVRLNGGGATVRNCIFSETMAWFSTYQFGWIIFDSTGNTVEDCTLTGRLFADNTGTMHVDCRTGTNTLQRCSISYGKFGVYGDGGTINILDCTFTRCHDGLDLNVAGTAAVVKRCTFVDFGHGALRVNGLGSTLQAEYCLAYISAINASAALNAYIVDPDSSGAFYNCVAANMARQATGGKIAFYCQTNVAMTVRNCIAYNCGYGLRRGGIYTAVPVTSNNCIYGNATNYENWAQGANDISSDPLFLDNTNNDYRIGASSPCVDAGIVVEGVTDGYQGSAPDIGYFETTPANRRGLLSNQASRFL